jgi:glycosyltransferase involved in cell wall biosynthesis
MTAWDLVIVLPHLGPGGAQKVALLAAEQLLGEGRHVALLTLLPDKPKTHQLPDGLVLIDLAVDVAATTSNRALLARGRRFLLAWSRRLLALGLVIVLRGLLRGVRPGQHSGLVRWLVFSLTGSHAVFLAAWLRRHQPPRVLSLLTRTNLLCCAALWDQPGHLVVSERNDPRLQVQPFPWPWLRGWLWSRANCITANTAGVLEGLQRCDPARAGSMRLLPNPLVIAAPSDFSTRSLTLPGEHYFLAVCRLVPQKGIDLLLQAYAALSAEIRAGWPLVIAGDGPERRMLEQMVPGLGLEGQVHFLGFVSNPQSLYGREAVFVLPSRFEGMPNALLEAMGAGMTVVVSDASSGPLEVVINQSTGLVFPNGDVEALAHGMDCASRDALMRTKMGNEAKALMSMHRWEVLGSIWNKILKLN